MTVTTTQDEAVTSDQPEVDTSKGRGKSSPADIARQAAKADKAKGKDGNTGRARARTTDAPVSDTPDAAKATTPKRDPRLGDIAKAAQKAAEAGGRRLADTVGPGNIARAEGALGGKDPVESIGIPRATLVRMARGTAKVKLNEAQAEAFGTFRKTDPVNFPGRRGAAILLAIHDARRA